MNADTTSTAARSPRYDLTSPPHDNKDTIMAPTSPFAVYLVPIFLVYGVAFVVLGATIVLQLRITKSSVLKLRDVLWLLAVFGLAHGTNELVDMLEIAMGPSLFFAAAGPALLIVSFAFLFFFGVRLLAIGGVHLPLGWVLPLTTCALVALPLGWGVADRLHWTVSARYFLCLPAGMMSAIGLVRYYRRESERLGTLRLRPAFYAAAAAFGVYALLAGLVVPFVPHFPASIVNARAFMDAFGIPVQLVRAACALILMWSFFRILNIFNYETHRKLEESKELLERVTEGIAEGIFLLTRDFRILWANKTLLDAAGCTRDDVVGKHCYEVTHRRESPCTPSFDLCPIEDIIKTGKPSVVTHTHLTRPATSSSPR